MYCVNCGAKMTDGAYYCQNCGASLKPISTPSLKSDDKAQQAPTGDTIVSKFAVENSVDNNHVSIPASDFFAESVSDSVLEHTIEPVSDQIPSPFPETVSDPIPSPFPETVPDDFDPSKTAGVSVTGMTSEEILNSEIYNHNTKEDEDCDVIGKSAFFDTAKAEEDLENSGHWENRGNNENKGNNENNQSAKPFASEKPVKEKVYFGKPAFFFCLVIITALSVLCGVFAGLYLKTTKKNPRAGAVVSGVVDFYDYYGGSDNG